MYSLLLHRALPVLGLLVSLLTLNCDGAYKTVSLQLPDQYEGSIWVVPVPDTLPSPVHQQGDAYLVSEEGIVYLPASVMKGVSRYTIYQHGQNIEPQMQYSGVSVDHVKGGERRYVYFYLPPQTTRTITSDDYWREQMVPIQAREREKMEALLKAGKLRFYGFQ